MKKGLVDVSSKNWLTRFLREQLPALLELEPVKGMATGDGFDGWLSHRVDRLSFSDLETWHSDVFAKDAIAHLAERLFSMLRIAFEVRQRVGVVKSTDVAEALGAEGEEGAGGQRSEALELAIVLAAASGETDSMRALMALRQDLADDPTLSLVDALAAPMRRVGKAVARWLRDDDDPLIGTPFDRVMRSSWLRLTGRLALASIEGELDEPTVAKYTALADMRRQTVVEAVIGLVKVDGRINKYERSFLMALVRAGHFASADVARLKAIALHDDVDPDEIAANIPSDDRRPVMKILYFAALIDDVISGAEERYIDRLGDAWGMGHAERLGLLAAVAAALEGPLGDATREMRGLRRISRVQSAALRHLEASLSKGTGAVVAEFKQTGDLLSLVAASSHRRLTREERKRAQRQLRDLAKTIPVLAVFAVPGGSLLLPLLAKVLPFDLAPTSFREVEQDL